MKTKSTIVIPQNFTLDESGSNLATNQDAADVNAFGSGLQATSGVDDAEETLDLDTDKKRYLGVLEDGNPILVKADSLS